MMRILVLATAFVALAGPSLAGGKCNRPYAPVIKVSAASSKQELTTVRGDVTSFIAASDVYQKCLASSGGSSQATALIEANQADKERVGKAFNTFARTFRVAAGG